MNSQQSTQNTFSTQGSQYQQNNNNFNNNADQFALIYEDAAQKLEPTLTSIQAPYKNPITLFVKSLETKDAVDYLRFQNNRVTDKFEKNSNEMTRVADILGRMQNKPSTNYEYEAAQEYYNKGGKQYYSNQNGQMFQHQLATIAKSRHTNNEVTERSLPRGVKNDQSYQRTQLGQMGTTQSMISTTGATGFNRQN